jgi:hypothetical protein
MSRPPDTSKVNAAIAAVGAGGKAKVLATGTRTVADSAAYTVTLAVPSSVPTGGQGSVALEIVPKKGWHMNKEFPTKLTVVAPSGVSVARPEQSAKDAVAFDDTHGRWSIDFSATAAGDKAFTGKIKFAVCTESSCDPKKEELAWNVKVE